MNHVDETSQRRAARIAGAMYLLTMASSIGEFAIRSSFMMPGDATGTAENIKAAERLFRLNIVVDLATVSGLIVLAVTCLAAWPRGGCSRPCSWRPAPS